MADDARPKLLAPAGFGGADSDPDQVPARRASVEFFSSTLGVLSSGETDMDAFISHSSEDSEIAARVAKALKAEEVDVWLDLSSIRAGQLLGADVLEHIRECDSLVLLWSESASDSEWVNTEWLMAVNERKFLVPCVLDDTRPPQCMETVTSVDFRKGWERGVIELRRSIQEGRGQGPTTTPVMVSTSRDCRRDADRIKAAQSEVLGCLMRRDLKGAEEKSATAGRMLAEARAAWKFDPMIQYNLRGYHCKNEFVWRNWDAINGGQAPAHDPIRKPAGASFAGCGSTPSTPMPLTEWATSSSTRGTCVRRRASRAGRCRWSIAAACRPTCA